VRGNNNWFRGICVAIGATVLAFVFAFSFSSNANAQSLIAGDITGTVLDPTSAVVPGVTVNLKGLDTGAAQATTTNAEGTYRFTLLKPGRYEISVQAKGFARLVANVVVNVGQTTMADLKLEMLKAAETIEVTAAAPLINTDPGNSTSFTEAEVQLLPSGGADITNIAFTAPGVVVNVTGGFGNFTVNGLPATSNLFTVNGENDMDPYFNINNSGATNLTLGQNEIQEATVTTNPYSGEFGQLIGGQISYVTKSGTNQYHGNLLYWWNGDYLNANNFFSNAGGSPRPFANANQWAASIGGPIFKNKTFFFLDTEGMRFILPNVFASTVPTPAFAAAVLPNVTAQQPNEAAAYTTMLGIWANAKGNVLSSAAMPGCNANLILPGFTPNAAGDNCAQIINTTPTSFAKEWILSGRVDHKLTDKDNIFFRYKSDKGLQPTTIDAFDSRFDANSNQPAWDAQANETHVFNPRSTNAFTASASHYVAQFLQNTALVQSIFPYATTFAQAITFTPVNGAGEAFPQGRNITQYQFIDDFSHTHGKHNLKFGENFRRYDVSDHNFFFNTPLVYFRNISHYGGPGVSCPGGAANAPNCGNGLQGFVDGRAFQYRRADSPSQDVPVALWGIGFYGADEWKVSPRLTLTLALRAERNSNPVCQTNCFANFTGPFSTLASVAAGAGAGDVPYSSDIKFGQHQAFHGVDAINLSPRVAFSWSPFASNKTVISGGAGLFYDNPAVGLVDNLLANPPVSVQLRVRPSTGALAFDTTANGAAATFAAGASAFNITQSYNQIKAALAAQGIVFNAPAFNSINGTVHAPQAQEWNLKVQEEFGRKSALTVNYVGNHVIRIPYTNSWANAFDPNCLFCDALGNPTVPGVSETGPVVPNYANVNQVQSGAISNYNGVTFSLREQFSGWFLAHFNYTYSHNLDEVSNGGLFTYGDSILGQINPTSLRASNYGNSDYDIRHLFSADYVLTPGFHFGNKFLKQLAGGWQWSGKVFARTGLPFSITDGNWNGSLVNGGGTIFAQPIAGVTAQATCGKADVVTNTTPTPPVFGVNTCLNPAAFIDSGANTFTGYAAWPGQNRNQFHGPHYFDMDMALYKTFHLKERSSLGIGMAAFNVFNHPNFATPGGLASGTFGQLSSTVGTPTSPYGNFLGFDSSVRVVQLSAKVTF
jgi:carboxypeptidase family protein